MSDFLSGFISGVEAVFTLSNLSYCFLGALLGTFVGVLPGVGPLVTIALLLPFTFLLDPGAALIMLAGIYYGSAYGGSTTSILLNIPGETASVITCIDGHAMARQGRAGPALAISAIGSFFAGSVATLIIALCAPLLSSLALLFGPADYFSLMLLGLIGAIVLAQGSLLKAFAVIILGMLLGLMGIDINSGMERYTFGVLHLTDGISFVALAMGLFGISEIVRVVTDREQATGHVIPHGRIMLNRDDLRQSAGPVLRGTLIGSLFGLLPGGGSSLATFCSYTIEKKIAANPGQFGHGAIAGVAGPESANNAAAQTSFIPLLTLGLPSNGTMALMAGAMMIHGITPGPQFITDQPTLFWSVIASMWIGNVMLLALNLPLVGVWVQLLRIPYRLLYPVIIMFCCIGIYSVSNSSFDIFTAALFGLIGFGLAVYDYEPAPLLMGFILGPMMEENLRRAMMMSRGNFAVFIEEPISLCLLLLALVLLIVTVLPSIKKRRRRIFAE
ncbi:MULTISPECIES: tripartite tricarboxylate transporter permease [unclassified Brenneria]|uniref:tripartite tricarboxylate transporter permease n=1 Tax=unclassified Brenneria TaxID=2634434 RepID=UPI0029C212A2|nr:MULTISPECIES: tripartite tricarboxylate transporter permease [unclassified Brenneria]MDX5630859.1 tripartite tricarboxylate transporter permease [Brenneria sp. L3-3Z]MDX5697941.1 tripartite tricarboxylate transporter permease [Brenneria sp. L4-2C]